MSEQPKLGQLPDSTAQRDAIHVAIAPVIAANMLLRAQWVRLLPDGRATDANADDAIGIVDPFIDDHVEEGQRFYLCLFPGTVTGMRHHWSHPAFVVKAPTRSPETDRPLGAIVPKDLTPPSFPTIATESGALFAADWWDENGDPDKAEEVRAFPRKAKAEAWLRDYAERVSPYDRGTAFEKFMANVKEGEIFYHGSDCHSLSEVERAEELFENLSIVLGRAVGGDDFQYSCSC